MTEVVLSAEAHFESLREPVWSRFKARHGFHPRDRFEEAYAEWWTRELERAAAGRPSRAAAPTAFVAEAVHRVLIDDARARARGLARSQKAALEFVDLEEQLDVSGGGDTAATAHYEAVVHRVLDLVRHRLTTRELRVFVFTFLYLRTTGQAAAALGLSEPRVKKDRAKVMSKVGAEVWHVLSGELPSCPAYDDKALPAVFELMTAHAEDCPDCSQALGGLRRGAVAVVAPVELLFLAGETPVTALDVLVGKLTAPLQRAVEASVAMPPAGRALTAVAVAATAGLGGSAAVKATADAKPAPTRAVVVRHAPVATAEARSTPRAAATAAPRAAAAPAPRRERRRTSKRRTPASPAPTPVATATPVVTPVPTSPPAPVATTAVAPSPPPPPAPATTRTQAEFGFESH